MLFDASVKYAIPLLPGLIPKVEAEVGVCIPSIIEALKTAQLLKLTCPVNVPPVAGIPDVIPVNADPSMAGKAPVKLDEANDPERVVAAQVPVIFTPVAVVFKREFPLCFYVTDESVAIAIELFELDGCSISATFIVDIIFPP